MGSQPGPRSALGGGRWRGERRDAGGARGRRQRERAGGRERDRISMNEREDCRDNAHRL